MKYRNRTPLPLTVSDPTFELGYILGIHAGGDGYIAKQYYMTLMSHSREFCEAYAKIVEKWCGKHINIKTYKRIKQAPYQKEPRMATEYVACWSYAEANRLLHAIGACKKANWRVPEIVKNGSPIIQGGYLSGLFDSEGNAQCYITLNKGYKQWIRRIRIYSRWQEPLEEVNKILSQNGIIGHIYYTKNRNMHNLCINEKASIARFQQLSDFQIPTKKERLKKTIESFDISATTQN